MNYLALVFLAFLCVRFLKFAYSTLWIPFRIQSHFKRQGISGPGYRPVFGNTPEMGRQFGEAMSRPSPLHDGDHDILPRVAPFYRIWSNMYGKPFLFWSGTKPRLVISDPDMIKEVTMNTGGGSFDKTEFDATGKILFGQGLVVLMGQQWAIHRRILNHPFRMEKVKAGWLPKIVAETSKMLEKWEGTRAGRDEFELDVFKELHELSADIISRTAFGSFFEEGKRIFSLQEKQMQFFSLAVERLNIPGLRFLPTKSNRTMWRLGKETSESIRTLIRANRKVREDSSSLLSLLMSSYKNQDGEEETLIEDEIIGEFMTFHFTGKETAANALSWVLLLLALNPEWQDKAREEVIRVLGSTEVPAADNLKDLKIVNMIIDETLRLYPPIVMLMRKAYRDVKLGNIDIPAGTELYLSLAAVHHDTGIWGNDAHKFNPWRFKEPRKHLASFIPFGLGPRYCVGQTLATVEMKITVAMIIRQYYLAVSPTYVHAPKLVISLEPQYGLQLLLTRTTL
ncbi:hypothetical protein V6N11_039125 [Hibiscus sabdariffa]|uniref:Cytochrome P450 n=1 Tax=Hibiscus sabdariffa TaxID=183260 RepID=A0ABR2SM09_9ROSI